MRSKCSNNIINQHTKSGHKVKGYNSSSVNSDILMIDDCAGVDESNEKSVGFVQEWINTYDFLSREFLFAFLLIFLIRYEFFFHFIRFQWHLVSVKLKSCSWNFCD